MFLIQEIKRVPDYWKVQTKIKRAACTKFLVVYVPCSEDGTVTGDPFNSQTFTPIVDPARTEILNAITAANTPR